MLIASILVLIGSQQDQVGDDWRYLRQVAQEVVDSARVLPGAEIRNGGKNTTGYTLRVPGGTQSYYPAFWIRDAAMMLGGDLVPVDEIEGWIRVVAATQPGPRGLSFPHGLRVPAYSIPDHITLAGRACWYPGAYTNQGNGAFGFLPPADDAFYFIQMVSEYVGLSGTSLALKLNVKTGWGEQPLYEVCAKAFESVEADPQTGLVTCSDEKGQGRVDWGFCDSITKTGSCLMPSLLRWQAAVRLANLFEYIDSKKRARQFRNEADLIAGHLKGAFFHPLAGKSAMLISATGVGQKDDVWATGFAVWLGVFRQADLEALANHLRDLIVHGGTVVDGQVRHIPPTGSFGGYWEQAKSAVETYQNGGYWATPTGWLIAAVRTSDRRGVAGAQVSAERILHDYVTYLRENRSKGAPFEWINPIRHTQTNGNYASSAGLVYNALLPIYH